MQRAKNRDQSAMPRIPTARSYHPILKSDVSPETPGQARVKPVLHELRVRDPDWSLSYGYLVVEVTRSSFPEACRYLRDTPWLDNDLVPLVLSHYPLTAVDVQLLPKRVPWLRAMPEVHAQLHALRTALAMPLEERGLICVDFADFVAALANGGESQLSQVSAPTASLACDALFCHEALQEWLSAAKMAICLHIRAGLEFTMSEFDIVGRRLESFVAEEALVIISAGVWEGDGVELTLLAVSRRR